MIYQKYIKRFFDLGFAILGLIILSPVYVVVVITLFIANDGKPFFTQLRPGCQGKIFTIYKFKTMSDQQDNKGQLLPDELRLSGIGKWVRKLSLDELPQLLNVVKGEMSLVGPRPLLVEYLPLYNSVQKQRHNVKPGITGWAQVNGRNAISWEDKFKYDVFYVNNCSFVLDVKILFLTVLKVFKREGISQDGKATMDRFYG